MEGSFLGRGWSFPPTFDTASGVRMLDEERDVASSLHILLSTARGERVMLPQYGCNLDELVFERLDTRMNTLIRDKIASAILYHESRITIESITVDDTRQHEGMVVITVSYIVKSTNSRFNLVYPFYINEGTDINLTSTIDLIPTLP